MIYPVYVPSKGRPDSTTARCLSRDGVPFFLVVEEAEAAAYRKAFPKAEVLVLPFSDRGSVVPARNWIKEHATALGAKRHWQLDDNIAQFRRWFRGARLPCNAALALGAVEAFTDRYENVAIAGLQYTMFCVPGRGGKTMPPFYLNGKVYSMSLVLNSLPHSWRGVYNEDTDLCLQVLADGWCTVCVNAFMGDKACTMVRKGGNTGMYQGDGRLRMARELERRWPYVVKTKRRFNRPQHVVRDAWRKFDNKLVRRGDLDWEALEAGGPDNMGMKLKQVRPVKSKAIRDLLES